MLFTSHKKLIKIIPPVSIMSEDKFRHFASQRASILSSLAAVSAGELPSTLYTTCAEDVPTDYNIRKTERAVARVRARASERKKEELERVVSADAKSKNDHILIIF